MKTAKIFKNGQSQAVRLPKEFRFDTEEVYIARQGDLVILKPKQPGWDSFFESLDEFSSDFMNDRQQPAQQKRKELEDLFQ